jgi:DNA gyrase subunit A
MGRATQGVTLISLDDGEKLAGLEKIVETVGDEAEVVGEVVGESADLAVGEPPADPAGEVSGEE